MKSNLSSNIQIRRINGAEVRPYLEDLARLRIEVFREWPYLYEGSLEYEREYLETLAASPDNVLVLALHGEQVVGASTGLPFQHEPEELKAPFRQSEYPVEQLFYFSESVLQLAYRGLGIGKVFFREREAWARDLGRFDFCTFCGVVRPDDHPLRPPQYRPLDTFWMAQGFEPTALVGHLSWKDLDKSEESFKPLRFWIKKITNSK